MRTQNYRLRPIDAAAADALRASGGTVHVATEHPGFPCRQCLRDAEVGDELLLVSHDPFTADAPYRSASPIFLHRDPCVPPEDLHELPTQLTERQLSVRSFDPDEVMIDAHNATRGCWAVTIERV